MEDAFKDVLCRWRAAQLRLVLLLMAEHSHRWGAWAAPLVTNPFPMPGHGDMPWIEALDQLVQETPPPPGPRLDGDPHETLLRALVLACLWLSIPAREVLFSDSRLVFHVLQTKPPVQPEVQRMLPLIQFHLKRWADRSYQDPLLFIVAVREDWMFGTTVEHHARMD